MIEKNKDLFSENEMLAHESELYIQKLTQLEDQYTILQHDNKRTQEQGETASSHVKDLENTIFQLREELNLKEEMLDEYQRNMNDSRLSERVSMSSQILITPQDLADLKRNLADKIKKLQELDQILNQQSIKYEMEQKKTQILFNENKKLKDSQKELNYQIEEFNEILDEKETQMFEYEALIKKLENDLNAKQFNSRKGTLSKNQQMMNPMVKAQKTLMLQKSKSAFVVDMPAPKTYEDSSHAKRKKQQFIETNEVKERVLATGDEGDKKVNAIRVKCDIEDFR